MRDTRVAILDAAELLERAQERRAHAAAVLTELHDAMDSSGAVRNQAAHAVRRAQELLGDATRLIQQAEQRLAEARRPHP